MLGKVYRGEPTDDKQQSNNMENEMFSFKSSSMASEDNQINF